MDWRTTGDGVYRIDLYVSADQTLDTSTDIRFFGQNCQEGFPLMKCGRTGSFDCRFTTQNKISCGTVQPGVKPERDLTAFLTSLPQSAYIILRFQDLDALAQNATTSTTPVAVTFR